MAIPSFQEVTLPLLQLSADRLIRSIGDATEQLASHFKLSVAEREELLPSGRQSRFANRVAWARFYLEKSGLLQNPSRGRFQITDLGLNVLKDPPQAIDQKYLERFPEYLAFKKKSQDKLPSSAEPIETATPEEALVVAYDTLRANLASDLLETVKASSPQFFERLVVELLLKMGYGRAGGSGRTTGRSGDEGIDGVIAEDRLGLEMVYLQAKKWQGTVGRPEIQKFVGALHGQRAKKGVFITTGVFSAEAYNYVQSIDPRVALIDGEQLAQFMLDFNVGVSTDRTYEIKRFDSDYFDEGA
jgi:restriction system protein